jgi:hypothetical protein
MIARRCRLVVGSVLVLVGASVATGSSAPSLAHSPGIEFVVASPGLLAECRATAVAVGYPVPCPTRVPAGLVAYGGRPGCGIDIIGPGRQCPNAQSGWRGWVVGSSAAGDEHLVLTASPRPLANYGKVVNGPAWYPTARVRVLGSVKVNRWRMSEVYVPAATNDGSAFSNHLVLIWTTHGHTYAVGFHNLHGFPRTPDLDLKLARGIRLVGP